MTQPPVQITALAFADFLERSAVDGLRYDLLVDGSLVVVPSEAEINSTLVMWLLEQLAALISFRLVKVGVLELEVIPQGDNKRNRRPDLAILSPEHLKIESLKRRTALFWGSLPPRFVVEVVSPGAVDSENYQRDYVWKRQQYQAWQIPEYWIMDPHRACITVLVLVNGIYEAQRFQGKEPIESLTFPDLAITAGELLNL